jgi:hypothetical protein
MSLFVAGMGWGKSTQLHMYKEYSSMDNGRVVDLLMAQGPHLPKANFCPCNCS